MKLECDHCGKNVFSKELENDIYVKKVSNTRYDLYCKCGNKVRTIKI